ncbi:MAG: hypothetical protein OSJ52_12315 [Lachnospiraceae bacterium]|nr:hypothetical protein [Lachnospiraceae bacterium]
MEQATSHGGSGMGQEQNQTKEKDWRQLSILSISEDAMEAHLTLWPTAEEEGATEEEIVWDSDGGNPSIVGGKALFRGYLRGKRNAGSPGKGRRV